MPGNALMPPMLDTWMMWPLPCARMIGSAAWVTQSAPKKFVSSCARTSASVSSSTMPKWP